MRVGSLVSAGTEILFALGLGPSVVGVSHECDFPSEVRGLPRLTKALVDASASSRDIDAQVRAVLAAGGGNAELYHVDADAIARVRADVLVTQRLCEVCAVAIGAIERAIARDSGIALVTLTGGDLAGVWADIARVASACAVEDSGARLIRSLDARRARVRERVAGRPRPRVVCLEWIDPLFDAGHWVPEQIEEAGGEEALAIPGRPSCERPWSDVRDADPDALLVMACGFDVPRAVAESAALFALPGFAELRAVRARRAWIVDGNALYSRPGPRLVDGIELAAGLLHPGTYAVRRSQAVALRPPA